MNEQPQGFYYDLEVVFVFGKINLILRRICALVIGISRSFCAKSQADFFAQKRMSFHAVFLHFAPKKNRGEGSVL